MSRSATNSCYFKEEFCKLCENSTNFADRIRPTNTARFFGGHTETDNNENVHPFAYKIAELIYYEFFCHAEEGSPLFIDYEHHCIIIEKTIDYLTSINDYQALDAFANLKFEPLKEHLTTQLLQDLKTTRLGDNIIVSEESSTEGFRYIKIGGKENTTEMEDEATVSIQQFTFNFSREAESLFLTGTHYNESLPSSYKMGESIMKRNQATEEINDPLALLHTIRTRLIKYPNTIHFQDEEQIDLEDNIIQLYKLQLEISTLIQKIQKIQKSKIDGSLLLDTLANLFSEGYRCYRHKNDKLDALNEKLEELTPHLSENNFKNTINY